MTVDEFLTWSSEREGHWELFRGDPVAMSPERAIHGRTIYKVANALERAIQAANTDCHVLLDSVMVRIDEHTSFQPDVLVYCGPRVSDDALEIEAPKTSAMQAVFGKLGVKGSALVLLDAKNENVEKSVRNIAGAKLLRANYHNVRDLLGCDHLILSLPALEVVRSYLGGLQA